jgi:hypothetical protein
LVLSLSSEHSIGGHILQFTVLHLHSFKTFLLIFYSHQPTVSFFTCSFRSSLWWEPNSLQNLESHTHHWMTSFQ